jgi:Alternative complex III, ActD subunit
MEHRKNYLLGVFEDEDVLLPAIQKIRESGVKIEEVFSPYPVHGIEEKLGYKRSKMSVAAFIFGACGLSFAIWMQLWMMGYDWPMIIGGKNYASVPPFVPVAFEMTVLIGALGMVGTFFVLAGLNPWAKPRIFDLRSTDDKHIMAIDLAANNNSEGDIKGLVESSGASEVYRKDFED